MRMRSTLPMHGLLRTLLLAGAITLPCAPALALGLPPVLSDGVVFQRGKPIRLWGTAKPGEKVTAAWGNLTGSAAAGDNGQWRIDLPAAQQDPGGSIVVTGSAGEQLRIASPLLGQVWLCGGQSNMGMQLKRTEQASMAGQPLAAPARVRLFRAPTPDIRRLNEGLWVDDSREAASGFSAVCYLTGRMLAEHAKDVVGLIDTSVGATGIEAWVPEAGKGIVTPEGRQRRSNRHSMAAPGAAFEAVVRPIAPFNAKGLLWYQGEGDYRRNPGRYAELFAATMAHWRKSFEQPDLPIVYMQLPQYDAVRSSGWEEVRNQQAKAERMLPGLRMAASSGIVATEIHPTDKIEVARRLFARATAATP
ncbi:MAG: sialate O-acetylesterase [Ramlibacter sp.]|jgi:sialate O-acetylesterase|nr:sialate O-acetylesterase [Ramlibacter sp.]